MASKSWPDGIGGKTREWGSKTNVEERKITDNSKEMLEQDLAGEELAITRYKKRVEQARELGEYGIARVLEQILMDEEEHRRDLLSSLGK